MDIQKVKAQAIKEIEDEQFRKEVDKYKEKLKRKRSLWDKIVPFKVVVIKKGG